MRAFCPVSSVMSITHKPLGLWTSYRSKLSVVRLDLKIEYTSGSEEKDDASDILCILFYPCDCQNHFETLFASPPLWSSLLQAFVMTTSLCVHSPYPGSMLFLDLFCVCTVIIIFIYQFLVIVWPSHHLYLSWILNTQRWKVKSIEKWSKQISEVSKTYNFFTYK